MSIFPPMPGAPASPCAYALYIERDRHLARLIILLVLVEGDHSIAVAVVAASDSCEGRSWHGRQRQKLVVKTQHESVTLVEVELNPIRRKVDWRLWATWDSQMMGNPSTIFADKDRLVREAAALRLRSQSLPSGKDRDDLLREAQQCEMAARIEAWIESPGLQPPKSSASSLRGARMKAYVLLSADRP